MISKERLQELIEQGATIYNVCWHNVYEEKLGSKHFVGIANNKISLMKRYNGDEGDLIYHTKNLFETKEEAEWLAEFGCIERVERLELPNYEEFIKDKIPIKINGCNGCYIELNCKHNYLRVYDYDCDYEYYKDTISKEHYIEACQILKSLFTGEY